MLSALHVVVALCAVWGDAQDECAVSRREREEDGDEGARVEVSGVGRFESVQVCEELRQGGHLRPSLLVLREGSGEPGCNPLGPALSSPLHPGFCFHAHRDGQEGREQGQAACRHTLAAPRRLRCVVASSPSSTSNPRSSPQLIALHAAVTPADAAQHDGQVVERHPAAKVNNANLSELKNAADDLVKEASPRSSACMHGDAAHSLRCSRLSLAQ